MKNRSAEIEKSFGAELERTKNRVTVLCFYIFCIFAIVVTMEGK